MNGGTALLVRRMRVCATCSPTTCSSSLRRSLPETLPRCLSTTPLLCVTSYYLSCLIDLPVLIYLSGLIYLFTCLSYPILLLTLSLSLSLSLSIMVSQIIACCQPTPAPVRVHIRTLLDVTPQCTDDAMIEHTMHSS